MKPAHSSTEIIRYKIDPDNRETFKQAYEAACRYLQASRFCLGYQVIQGNEEPGNFIVIIQWTSVEDHLQGFRNSAEFRSFFNFVRPFYNSIEEMKHYDLTSVQWSRQ